MTRFSNYFVLAQREL